jgi:hypothetical protein
MHAARNMHITLCVGSRTLDGWAMTVCQWMKMNGRVHYNITLGMGC